MKRFGKKLIENRRGQTTVEYLMLMGMTFITAYLMITGPFSSFTSRMINQIKEVTGSVVRNGEMPAKSGGYPGSPTRLKPVHL